MVFVNTKRVAEKLEAYLIANGFKAQALSGDVPQKKRLRFMKEFHSGELAVLICTDVASRGLHIADVSHVFNYDLPQDAADYVHRIGRTARAGAEGDAISFGCEDYAICLPDIENYIGHKIPVASVTPELLARDVVFAPQAARGCPGRRSSGGGGGRWPAPGGGGCPVVGRAVAGLGVARQAAGASPLSGQRPQVLLQPGQFTARHLNPRSRRADQYNPDSGPPQPAAIPARAAAGTAQYG
jgi:ATP-dependent RNA helicase RhlB